MLWDELSYRVPGKLTLQFTSWNETDFAVNVNVHYHECVCFYCVSLYSNRQEIDTQNWKLILGIPLKFCFIKLNFNIFIFAFIIFKFCFMTLHFKMLFLFRVCLWISGILFSVNWVPLDEYYYGKSEGDLLYTEEKNEFRFKVSFHCWFCNEMIYQFF